MDAATFQPSRFRIVRCLGSGATGDVYEAWDRERGAQVALKTLRHLHPQAIARFKNEFRALQDVEHANLISIGELLEEDGHLFFTMELVRGKDFLAWTGGDEARLRHALIEMSRGLHALHAAGKVHRDIKPSNVLITDDGRVVVLDFGLLADAEQGDTWSGQAIVGTPHYMAPEQAAGQTPGAAADWYAVGVMLYEALTGTLPYDGPLMKILLDKQQVEPPAPETLAPEAPADLVALCKQLLAFDPAKRPTGEAVLRKLGRAPTQRPTAPPSTPLTHGPPFVGRLGELATLQAALDTCAAGRRPAAVLVEGDSGVGKSTLVRVFSRSLGHTVAVLSGRCFERESVSYKAFDGVVEAAARLLARMEPTDAAAMLPLHGSLLANVFPTLKRVKAFANAPLPSAEATSRELRTRVFGALRELLIRLAERRPLVIVIDDLQWADEDSLALLGEVLRPPDAPPVLLVVTLRPTSGAAAAGAAARVRAACPDTRTIALGPLAPDESRELAGMLLHAHGVEQEVDLDGLSREAAGHPLFLDELVRHVAASGAAATADLHLDDVVGQRVAALEARAREVVELVVVAGQPLYQETFARAADVAPEALGRLVSALRVSNLVRTGGARPADTIEPYHDRVRDAIIARLDGDRRKELHRALAAAIEGSPHPGQESILAFHWNGAGRPEIAARHAALAGTRAAEALAFDQAARAFAWALELGHPDRAELLERLGDALGNTGRGEEAADAYLQAAEAVGVDVLALELRRRAAEQLLISGHIDRGMELTTTVLSALGMSLPPTPRRALLSLLLRRARLRLRGLKFTARHESEVAATELTRVDLCWSVATGLAMVDTIRGADFQTRHLLLALRAGEPTRVAKALAVEGGFLSTSGPAGRERAERLFVAAHALLDKNPSPFATALLLGAECINKYQGGAWRRAFALSREAERAVRNQGGGTGIAWQLDTIHFFWLYTLFYLGDLNELAAQAPTLLRAATERGDIYAATNLRVGIPNAAWLVRDETARADEELATALRQWSVQGFHLQHYHHLLGIGQLHLYTGDGAAGHAALAERWKALEGSLILRIELVRREAECLRARLAVLAARQLPARRDELLREAAKLCAHAAKGAGDHARGWAGLAAAGIAATRGDTEGAVAQLRAAIPLLEVSDMAVYAAVARGRLGALLGGDEGAAMVAESERALRVQHVVAPTRFARMLAPGFDDDV